jgi:hypothetical protein
VDIVRDLDRVERWQESLEHMLECISRCAFSIKLSRTRLECDLTAGRDQRSERSLNTAIPGGLA